MTYRSIYLEKLTKVIAMIADVWWPCGHPPFRPTILLLLHSFLFVEFYVLERAISVGCFGPLE